MTSPPEVVVVGLGEVGRPLLELISTRYVGLGIDVEGPERDLPNVAVLHICLPFQGDEFLRQTERYIQLLRPRLTIVNSTVAVGTTRQVEEKTGRPIVYSPVRGKRLRMLKDLTTYTKFVSGRDSNATEYASGHFESLGLKTKIISSPETLELAKLTETTYFGLLIAWAQEVERLSDKLKVSYPEITSFYDEIEFLPSTYFPGVIGGHCVMPNIDLLAALAARGESDIFRER
jgi:hypothetical protein